MRLRGRVHGCGQWKPTNRVRTAVEGGMMTKAEAVIEGLGLRLLVTIFDAGQNNARKHRNSENKIQPISKQNPRSQARCCWWANNKPNPTTRPLSSYN